MADRGALTPRRRTRSADGPARAGDPLPRRLLRVPGRRRPVLEGFDLVIPAGSSLAIVGQNGAGKTTLAKLLCRLYDPQEGAIEVGRRRPAGARRRVAGARGSPRSSRTSSASSCRCATTSRPAALRRRDPGGARRGRRLATSPPLDTPLARGYEGGTDLSGGQWQRVALARALCAVRLGAGVVLLDEPTAQLDVRGEAEIFERILAATRRATTILISHRFSTVRHADRICVLEHGRVVELGTHDELMALGAAATARCSTCRRRASRRRADEEGWSMTGSPDESAAGAAADRMPPALSSMWRLAEARLPAEPAPVLRALARARSPRCRTRSSRSG